MGKRDRINKKLAEAIKEEKEELNESRRYRKKNKRKNLFKKFMTFIFIVGTICCMVGLFLLYGPKNGFRDWLITTAMSTMNHQYFATWFYNNETIEDCLNRNSISAFSGASNTNNITFIDYGSMENIEYDNEYERQVLEKKPNNNDYKIIKIKGDKYTGILAVIYDPSRIEVVTAQNLGSEGQYLTTISENNNALVAINAGGFNDPNGNGNGGYPLGITISDGKLIYDGAALPPKQNGGLIGFTKDNKLFLGDISSKQALSKGIRSSVSFGPYLIMNGESVDVSGNGGGGLAPRSAIGQRKDGIVLFLALDGDRTMGRGATYADVLEIMENYGAYTAVNLDGGTSTGLTVHHKYVNDPTAEKGGHRSRQVPTAFILKADDSDDGDYSIVANKIN
ncbi:MAG: hypothetical protein HFJ45_10135 [Clostridia bacterium]|nr:hypothetical protein [Clostridia bacterium]